MDFRLPHPVKHSIKKKKRRWKLLGGETKKLSLKHHKKNVSCQTDSSESSESSASKYTRCRIIAANSTSKDSPSFSYVTNKENFRSVDSDRGKNFPSIYHYCTPARQYSRKDSPIPLKSYSSLNSSKTVSNSEKMNDYFDLREANSCFLPPFKRLQNRPAPKEKQKKSARRLVEDSFHKACNGKLTVASNRRSSSSSKLVASKRIPKEDNGNDICNSSTSVVSLTSDRSAESLLGKILQRTIILSDSESSDSSVKEPVCEEEAKVDKKKIVFDLDQTTSSDMSQIILESSISSSEINTNKRNEKDSQSEKKPLIRSSVLNRRFNSVVEKELAISSNVSEFYLRVKRRVLGLQNSNSTSGDVSNPKDEIIAEDNENEEFLINSISEKDKENGKSFSQIHRRRSYDSPSRENPVSPRSSSTTISSDKSKRTNAKLCLGELELGSSPKISLEDDGRKEISSRNKPEKSELGGRPEKLPPPSRKEFIIPESSDSDESSLREPHITNRRGRRKSAERKNNSADVHEIPDSELSSSSGGIQYRRKRAVFVVGSSESGSSTPSKSNCKDDMDLINDFHESDLERMNESESEESVCAVQEKQFKELEAEIGKSSSSDLFRRVTRRALVLDSSESPCLGNKQKAPESNPVTNKKTEVDENPNLKYQPGFSTLSQSKHEDIKRWLNAIPCSDVENNADSKKSEVSEPKEKEENIKLTDMQQVLNELYGDEWLNDTKLTSKAVVKKKESEIIIARLTDSDDSSTPPLPPSTPKRKLYNVNRVLVTPIPATRHVFTPLTSIGKRGGPHIFRTPKTADTKTKSVQRYVTSSAFSSPVLTFVASLSVDHHSSRCHPEAKYFMKNFKSKKGELARKLFQIFNTKVFSDKLPADLPIIWNNRLRKTAGYCYNRRIKSSDGSFVRSSRVELSSKIVDNSGRLRDTLIHELCHAATWIISEVTGGHGPTWKRWTYRAMEAFPEIPPISRCHNYDIETKYKYKCSGCNYSIGRHSKSLDVERKVCGICGGKFELFVNNKSNKGKPMPSTPRTPNAFALFVKENYGSAKKSKDNLKHKDVMKILSEQFAATKINTAVPEEKD